MALNPVKTSEEFLGVLSKRAREVLERRFGVGKSKERKTLEAIGASYGITRERVRQIEAHALKKLRGHELKTNRAEVFNALKAELLKRGGVSEENAFLTTLAQNPQEKNHLRFLLTLADDFKRLKEDDDFHGRWSADDKLTAESHEALKKLHDELQEAQPVNEQELKEKLGRLAKHAAGREVSEPALSSWISISKKLAQNKLGEWGLIDSPHITPRGVRDLAYLVMKRHGSPLHFSETASAIQKVLGERAHVQTVHNELIKDPRFVLVGRGLYALKEWGYEPGTVREVIRNILSSSGPLPKAALLEKVMKERHVKTATVLINLQNKKYFKTLADGRYAPV